MVRRFVVGMAVAALAIGLTAAPAFGVASPNGRANAFTTLTPLLPSDQDASEDVYLWREGGTLAHVSVDADGGETSTFGMSMRFISGDGRRVYFASEDALLPEDTDNFEDLYEWSSGRLRIVTQAAPGQPHFGVPSPALFRADGRRIFFESRLPIVAEDTDNHIQDVYVWEDGVFSLVSKSMSATTTPGYHLLDDVSDDGNHVVETTNEPLVGTDLDGQGDVYKRSNGTVELVSRGTRPDTPEADALGWDVTPDGSGVVFSSDAPLETNDLDLTRDLYQRKDGRTRLISANDDGLSPPCTQPDQPGPGPPPCINGFRAQSDDGSRVAFFTDEQLVDGDTDLGYDLYDRDLSTLTWLSGPPLGATRGSSGNVFLSPDGSRRIFDTQAELVPEDTDDWRSDYYLREGSTLTILTHTGSDESAGLAGMSRDTKRLYISTRDAMLPEDTDGGPDVYLKHGGRLQLVTTGPLDDHTPFDAVGAGLSESGKRYFFLTERGLVADDVDGVLDLYLWEDGQTRLVTP
jgi:hypothetical protein